MPEYDAGFDNFDNDDDLGNEEAIQALSNAEKNHDVKPHVKVLYYIDSILIQYQVSLVLQDQAVPSNLRSRFRQPLFSYNLV